MLGQDLRLLAVTSKKEHFVIIVNGWKPSTVITKCSILDVAAVLDPPLIAKWKKQSKNFRNRYVTVPHPNWLTYIF